MQPVPQYRTVLNWIQPSAAERFEIYSELGMPQAVLTITRPDYALIESRFGIYQIQRPTQLPAITVTDLSGSTVATIRTNWWGRYSVTFDGSDELRFRSSSVLRNRWLWRNSNGEVRAVVQRSRIFFSPEWPIREVLSALLAGLTIYLIVTKSSLFQRLMVPG
ncbi:hypothetical protein [Larkinella terrae]|uniref:Uncharacterized protein n=1 Tax=Larkinella terrae TaxID=2025311 RepID=A0A7K0EKH8_9BACT|nr:hypothetical protein [Larkinella terrae]MRS62317.1 hypothetical protein [Larkinella terrae]